MTAYFQNRLMVFYTFSDILFTEQNWGSILLNKIQFLGITFLQYCCFNRKYY